MAARLTIVIPTVNRAKLLRRALESALAQTCEVIEILVSDNGSTDDTPAVLSQYEDPRLRITRREHTVPRAQHGTLIFAEISTEFVLVLSDDDYIEPDFSHEVLRIFDENPEISFAYTGCIEHYDDETLPALVGPRIESSLDFILAHYEGKRQVSWCACVTRIADLRKFGPQPEDRIIGDMYFWTRITFSGPVGCVARALAHYTVLIPGGDNESRVTPVLAWAEDVKKLADEVCMNAQRMGATPEYQKRLALNVKKQIARTVANQFVWARIYGMSRLACARILPAALRYIGWHAQSLTRIAAALALPRSLVRALVLQAVARLADCRRRIDTTQ